MRMRVRYLYYIGIGGDVVDIGNMPEKYVGVDDILDCGITFSKDGDCRDLDDDHTKCIGFKTPGEAVEAYLLSDIVFEKDKKIITQVEEKIEEFMNLEVFLVKKNLGTGKLKILDKEVVAGYIDEVFDNVAGDDLAGVVDTRFDEVAGVIEGLIDDVAYLNISSLKSKCDVCIVRAGGISHRKVIDNGYDYPASFGRNGFFYNDSIRNIKRWLSYNLSLDNIVGISVHAPISNGEDIHEKHKNKERVFNKIYGLIITLDADGESKVNYLKPAELIDKTINIKTGKHMPPDPTNIYSNPLDKDDFICGFDLV